MLNVESECECVRCLEGGDRYPYLARTGTVAELLLQQLVVAL